MSGEKHAPELPVVVDEAGDSAPWVSLVGIAVALAIAIFVAVHLFGTRPESGHGADVAPADSAAK